MPSRKTLTWFANDPALELLPPGWEDSLPWLSRSWLQFRSPLRHPLAALSFLAQWRTMKREIDESPGLISFEYRLILAPLAVGMHVAWESKSAEARFVGDSTHKRIAKWALQSRLTPAMRIEHYVTDEDGRALLAGGFIASEGGDLLKSALCTPAL